jgi:hypothetical protein
MRLDEREHQQHGVIRSLASDRVPLEPRVDHVRESDMPDDKAIDEGKDIDEIVHRLQERFPDTARETVVDTVEQARASFAAAKVRDFVPVLIEKEAKSRLKGKSVLD